MCDSPCHSDKYGTYTMMSDSSEVITFSLVQVTEVTSSNAMEKEGFERCFKELTEKGVVVNRVATDRHPSIACAMDKQHQESSHQFDVWHLSKSIVKKLTKKSQIKGNEELKPWIRSVSNHLWWCSRTCEGNVDVLAEKWKSLLHHVTNEHHWSGNTHFHQCVHPPLTTQQQLKKKWLTPGSPAYVALEDIVLEKRLLKDLGKVTEFCHTGNLEVYHSLMLKYCPKRQHFSHKGMLARTQLTALDHNANCGREHALVEAGERRGEARYKVSFPKAQKQWVVKPIRAKKSYTHVFRLMDDVVSRCQSVGLSNECQITDEEPVNLPRNCTRQTGTNSST